MEHRVPGYVRYAPIATHIPQLAEMTQSAKAHILQIDRTKREPAVQQCGNPGPILGAVNLGIADDGEYAGHEQAARR
jgi:hypothetical protein